MLTEWVQMACNSEITSDYEVDILLKSLTDIRIAETTDDVHSLSAQTFHRLTGIFNTAVFLGEFNELCNVFG